MNTSVGAVPVVSIGMPVYNSAAFLEPTLDSLLNQTLGDFELIISDNASTDDTVALCERYAKTDPRVRLYRNAENIGANRNYLAVLRHARAPYFKWASSNDICAPTFLERCVQALEREPGATVAFSQTALFEHHARDAHAYEKDVELTSPRPNERYAGLFRTMGLNNCFNGVMRREVLLRAHSLGSYQGADVVLMAELALMGKFLLIPERLFFRRMSASTATRMKGARDIDQHIEPDARRPLQWQHWRFQYGLVRACVRQLNWSADAWRAMIHSLRQLRWSRHKLAQDLKQALTENSWSS